MGNLVWKLRLRDIKIKIGNFFSFKTIIDSTCYWGKSDTFSRSVLIKRFRIEVKIQLITVKKTLF